MKWHESRRSHRHVPYPEGQSLRCMNLKCSGRIPEEKRTPEPSKCPECGGPMGVVRAVVYVPV